jgi:2-phosphoglycerate kinase
MDWQVLLIGGGSGTGKTALARALGRRFDVSVIEGDLLRHVIEAAVPRGSDPALHIFKDPSFWEQDVDNVLAATERLARRVCQIAEVTVARQHYMGRPAILEAFWVEPEFAAQSEFDGIVMSGRVRSLFLFEDDREELHRRLLSRDGKVGLPTTQVSRLAHFHRHAIAVKERAEALGLPVLASRPFETLEARALAALRV